MIKKLVFLISLLIGIPLFSQTISLDAIAEPFPSPFISDWQKTPGIFNLTITNNTGNSISISIRAEIIKEGEVLGHGLKREINLESYGVRNIDNIDFLDLNSWSYKNDISDQITRSGRLPEGQYELCFSYSENRTVVAQSCAEFEIVSPEIPDLLEPINDVTVTETFPRFEWTPAFVPGDLEIKYRIKVCHNETSENPNYSITKVPILNTITDDNFIVYPPSVPPLEEGYMYVWQVQLLDENSNPIGENEGKTEIGRFIYGSGQAPGAITSINDGPGEDIDWNNSPTIAANWEGESNDFYYAVGTEAGGTNLQGWTPCGDNTSFSIILNLAEGTEYFVSVKAGEFGEPVSSDGCTIDITPPISSVDTLADSLQSPFQVSWSGADSISGIAEYIIQSKVEDSSFTEWVTLDSSTTSKSFSGESGKTYSFRSKAIDLAGNEENFPDSADAKTYVTKTGDSVYVLVPNVSYLKINDSTKIEEKDGKTTLKGKAKLVIEPTPFDNFEKEIDLSDSTICDSTAITFEKNIATNALEPIEGNILLSDTTGIIEVYKEVLKIVELSFKSKRPTDSRMMVDSAFLQMPFNIPKMNNSNLMPLDSLPITASGLAFSKELDKQWTKWGMTFTFKELALAAEESPPYIKAKTNVKFNKTSDTTTNFATNATIGFRGKDDIFAHVVPDSTPMRLIPNKDYVLLDSIWFEKPDDEWKLGAALQFKYPAPLDSITDQSKANILIGDDGFDLELAVINESRDSTFDANDQTALKICDYVAIDLTNVDLKLQSVENNGEMELSDEHSYVEFMADLYLGEKDPKRIAIGDPDDDKNGFKITFAGDPQAPGIKVKDNPFDIGPVRLSGFTEGSGLGISFDPFEISLSGGIGINKPGTFEGTVNFENLIINKNGLDFSNFMVLGGDVTVMDVITASIDSIGYSAEPTTLTFEEPQGDTTTTEKTVEVDSYFRLAGASLALNLEGDGGGGGCEEFLLYEVDNATNVVIREAWFEVKNTCKLTADLKYMEEPEPLLSFSGSAEIESADIVGVALGKIGKRGGKPTFGIFMAVSGLNANLGYVTLNDIGGGFFYRPLQSDIDQVKELVGLKQGSLMQNDITEIVQDEIPASDNLTFAIMLYAGIYVQSKEVCDANGLLTLTDNYFELLAKAKMLEQQAEGNLQLLVNWAPYKYGEGHVDFTMDREHVLKIQQQLEFFAYSDEVPGLDEDIWAVMGSGQVKVFPSTLSEQMNTEFFVGPPGFYFDVDIEKEYDFWIIDGSYGFGTMFWWEQSVSWGAYADVHGSLDLDHVAGVSCGLEGALIGAQGDILLYSVGSFRARFLGETVYSGSIWVSLGTNGVHGARGRNSTYDGYIESAKNMADNMKDEIEDMSDDIEQAKESASQLTEEQLIAAGEALYNIVGSDNLADINEIKDQYSTDINHYHGPNNNLRTVYNEYLFFSEAQTLQDRKEDIDNDTLEIQNNLMELNSDSDVLINRIQNYKSQVSQTLPQISETINLSNPVDTGEVILVSIDGEDVEIPANGDIDTETALQNVENTTSMKENIKAYKDSMLAQSENIIDDLVYADSILYRGDVSVNSLSINYYLHAHKLSRQTAGYTGYYNEMLDVYGGKNVNLLLNTKPAIRQDLKSQVNNIGESEIEQLITLRVGIRNYLLSKAGEPEKPMEDLGQKTLKEKKDYCIDLGLEVWFRIPNRGMTAIFNNTGNGIQTLITNFDNSRSQFFQQWNNIANSVETIHNVKSESYEYLYNLYDALSWEFEDGGPDNNLNNNAGQFAQNGYQFAGQNYGNINGGINQGVFNFQNDGGNFQGNVGNQNFGGVAEQNQNIDLEVIRALEIGTAARKIRTFDTYSSKREYIEEISFPPKVKYLNGSFDSDQETDGYYGILTLDYKAEHNSGGCFYNINLPGITNGPISLGTGETPIFYFFQPIEPKGSYNLELTSFANTGYSITNGINFPVDYYSVGYDDIEGGEVHTEISSEDETAPIPPNFVQIYYSASQDELIFEYQAEDPESGIAEYQYAVADSVWYEYVTLAAPPQRRLNIIRNWESTGGRQNNNIRGLASEHNDSYYIVAKAKNGAEIWSNPSISDKITIDKTPPSDFSIISFQVTKIASNQKITTHQSQPRFSLNANWTAASDPESEIIYILGLGSSEGSDDLIEFGPVYNNQTNIQDNIFTGNNTLESFYLTIKAINTSGLENIQTRHYQIKKSKSKKGKNYDQYRNRH